MIVAGINLVSLLFFQLTAAPFKPPADCKTALAEVKRSAESISLEGRAEKLGRWISELESRVEQHANGPLPVWDWMHEFEADMRRIGGDSYWAAAELQSVVFDFLQIHQFRRIHSLLPEPLKKHAWLLATPDSSHFMETLLTRLRLDDIPPKSRAAEGASIWAEYAGLSGESLKVETEQDIFFLVFDHQAIVIDPYGALFKSRWPAPKLPDGTFDFSKMNSVGVPR